MLVQNTPQSAGRFDRVFELHRDFSNHGLWEYGRRVSLEAEFDMRYAIYDAFECPWRLSADLASGKAKDLDPDTGIFHRLTPRFHEVSPHVMLGAGEERHLDVSRRRRCNRSESRNTGRQCHSPYRLLSHVPLLRRQSCVNLRA